MKSYLGNALVLAVICGGLVVFSGCTQNDDVIQPLLNTTVTLDPELLPDLDPMYVYELWMVKGDDITAQGAEFTSLGKFTYRNSTGRIYSADGDSVLSNSFDLPETWLAYDYIAITVENSADQSVNPSGTIILMDEVVDPVTRPIELKFPVSFFNIIGNYFVGSPTNDTTYWDFAGDSLALEQPDEEKGLWICSRFGTERRLHDTLAVLQFDTTMIPEFDPTDSLGPDTVGIVWPPDSNWVVETTLVYYGLDTLQHRRIEVEWIIDTLPEYDILFARGEIQYPIYDIDSTTDLAYPYPLGIIPFFEYSGPLGPPEDLPDIRPYGWRYNAWIMLDEEDSGDNSNLNLPTMIPFGNGRQEDLTAPPTWGVLPLGGFYRSDSADLSNTYLDNREVPNFPGEDFVVGAGAYANLNLRRDVAGRWGAVIVGMEPDPSNMVVDTTVNFPLFILSDDLPPASVYDPDEENVQLFHNWAQFLPRVKVSVSFSN